VSRYNESVVHLRILAVELSMTKSQNLKLALENDQLTKKQRELEELEARIKASSRLLDSLAKI